VLFSRGIVKIDNLTSEQVDFCRKVVALLELLTDREPATYEQLQLTPEEAEVAAIMSDTGINKSPMQYGMYGTGPFFVFRPTYVAMHVSSNDYTERLLDLLEQACKLAGEQGKHGQAGEPLAWEIYWKIRDSGKTEPVIIDVGSSDAAYKLAKFFSNMGIVAEKLAILELATSKEVLVVAERILEYEDADLQAVESNVGEECIELWQDERFEVGFMIHIVQALLDGVDSDETVFFSWVDTDDRHKPDYPSGGAVAVNRHSDVVVDGGYMEAVLLPDMIKHAGFEQRSCYGGTGECPECESDIDASGGSYFDVGEYTTLHEMSCMKCGTVWYNVSLVVSKQIVHKGEVKDDQV
jgi:hypothetical protein